MLATALVQVLRYAAKWQPRWSDLTNHEVHHDEVRGERRYSVVSLPDNPTFHVFSTHTADTMDDTKGPEYESTHPTLRDAKAAFPDIPAETTYSDAKRPPPKQTTYSDLMQPLPVQPRTTYSDATRPPPKQPKLKKLKSGVAGDAAITTRRKPFSFSQAVAETFGKRSRR